MINNAKRLLVVDDDDIFRIALQGSLEQNGYRVTGLSGGKKAQNLIGVQDFDAVVSDIRMADGNGLELLHFIKRTKPMPVILMTGYAELTEPQEATSLGADGFLPKPFRSEELLEILKVQTLRNLDGEKVENDEDFSKLSIDDFISGREIKYDIYIRLGQGKFIKVAHQGTDLPVDRIKAYKGKNIRFLYMKKDDFRKYVGFNLHLAKVVAASSQVNSTKKLNFLKHTSEVIMESLHHNQVDQEAFENARTVLETTLSVVSDQNDVFSLLSILNEHSDHLYAHSLAVSLYSSMIARQMKWTSPINMFKISMGGLLHDIGKKELDRTLLDKTRKEMTAEEVKAYETHTSRGVEILSEIRSVPTDVIQIASQHHEDYSGNGFPHGLKKNRIHPLARLVSTANEFAELVVKGPKGPGVPPESAIQRMLELGTESLEPAHLLALMALFKLTPPKGFGDAFNRNKKNS